MKYSEELREAILRRILPPRNEPLRQVARDENISLQTLYNWRIKALSGDIKSPDEASVKDAWSTQDKFHIVVETAGMSELELAEYARSKGLFIEQIRAWRDACMNANGGIAKEAARLNRELKDAEKKARQMEKELARKEKALSEAAALILLQKKIRAIWGEPEGE